MRLRGEHSFIRDPKGSALVRLNAFRRGETFSQIG